MNFLKGNTLLHRRLILSLLALLLAAPLLAASPRWTALGPFGGDVQFLTLDPTNPLALYANMGFQGGTYRTLDGGLSWEPIQALQSLGNVAVDPSRPATIYLAVQTADRILKSRDRGAHWAPASHGLPAGIGAGEIAVDPVQPSSVYAAVDGSVWHSRDRGATWQPSSQPLTDENGAGAFVQILVAPGRPAGTVYAGTPSGLFRSVDGGETWHLLGTGLPVGEVLALAVAPSDPRIVWVSLRDTGLYFSPDGGTSWQRAAGQIPESPVQALAVSPRAPRTLWAGNVVRLYRSTDGGAHWAADGLPARILAVAAGGRYVYAGVQSDFQAPGIPELGGVRASTNEGKTWQRRNQGLPGLFASDMAVDPANPRDLWAAMSGFGLFHGLRANSGTVPWTRPPQPPTGSVPPEADSVAVSAGGDEVYSVVDQQIWTSDHGSAWSSARTAPPPVFSGFVRTHPRDPATAYAAGPDKLYASHDAGASWQPLNLDFGCRIFDLAIAPSTPATLYAAGATPADPAVPARCFENTVAALSRSTDGGATWTSIVAGLPAASAINSVAVDPRDPRTLYVALNSTQVWKSTDGGATWAPSNVGAPFLTSVAVSPGTGTVWAGTFDAHVFASHDAGANWQPAGGPQTFSIRRLVPDPAAGSNRLYAVTWSGVWVLE